MSDVLMPTPFPSENLRGKGRLINELSSQAQPLPLKVYLEIHQVPFCFHVSDEAIISELFESYPLAWFIEPVPNATPVMWHDSRSMGYTDAAWEEEISYDCYVDRQVGRDVAVHRDFAASYVNGVCVLVCPYVIQDGFYNFLRWFVPIQFLGQNKLLLHSSCVLDQNKNAYFSLGVSGAGKTTIASLRPRKRILGDDMNVIKIENGKCWAQAGALGQALLNPAEYTNWYPVKALLWLKKSESFALNEMPRSAQVKCLATAVANVFWDNLSEPQAFTIFNYVNDILKLNKMFELSFPIERVVWDKVFESFKEEL